MTINDQSNWLTVVMPVHRPNGWLDEALATIPADCGIAVIIRDSTPESCAREQIDAHVGRIEIDYEYWPEMPSWTRKTNLGVEAAQTEMVCTLHQDDLWLPGRAKVLKDLLQQYPEASTYLTGAILVDRDSSPLGKWSPPFKTGLVDRKAYLDALIIQNSIAMPTPMVRRSAWLSSGGLDETLWYTPDWDLWLKLADQGPVAFSPGATTAFRIHGNSQTMAGDADEMERQMLAVVDRFCDTGSERMKIARASVTINAALARAMSGKPVNLLRAIRNFLALGPDDGLHYLRQARLFERTYPRLRAWVRGRLNG